MSVRSRGIFPPQSVFVRNLGIVRQRRIFQAYIGQRIELGGCIEFLELDLVDIECVDQFIIDRRFVDKNGKDFYIAKPNIEPVALRQVGDIYKIFTVAIKRYPKSLNELGQG